MDAVFNPLAETLGASVDQIKVITCLLLSYPLAALYSRLRHQQFKHIFSISVSLFYLIGVFGLWNGTLQLSASILATYLISANVTGKKMPWLVFTVVMGHLTINHLYRAFYDISLSVFEITGPQMVLTMKLTTFAWNVYDGRQPVETLDKWQLEKCVRAQPTLLEFFGYAFYFPGMLVGPSLEYANYAALVDESVFVSAKGKEKESERRRMPPGRKRVAYAKMTQGLVALGLFVVYGGRLNFSVILGDWWFEKPWWYHIAYIQLVGFFERTKYYAIWSLTEGAAIATGLGFTGYTASGGSKWNGAANVDILNIEFAPSFKVLLDSWNIKTNVWLRECIYKRVTPKGAKPGFTSSMLTFATSAFWHGVAGGYYMTFALGGFIQTAQRLIRSRIRPLFLDINVASANLPTPPTVSLGKKIYDVVGVITSTLLLNYVVIPFILLDTRSSIQGWHRAHWYGHIMVFGSLAFFWLGGSSWLPRAHANAASKKL